jgi:hypothetical protein
MLALPVAGLTSYFRISRETRTLRNSLLRAAPAQWDKTIELSVGALTLTLARAVLDRIDIDLEPEARATLQAVRGAEVGIYQRRDRRTRVDASNLLSGADQAMASRGWDRLVGIVHRQQVVGIYTPKTPRPAQQVEVCLLVVDDRQAVVVSARGDLEPLVNIALQHPQWPRRPSRYALQ